MTRRMSERRTSIIGAFLVALGPVSMALYTPAMPELVRAFSSSEAAIKMTLSLYFAGFAFAQLVSGTLSDVSGLSGVITSEDGTPQIAFSILINAIDVAELDAPVRRAIEDRIVTATLWALDDYEARQSGIAPPRPPTEPATAGRRRAPSPAAAPADRSRP